MTHWFLVTAAGVLGIVDRVFAQGGKNPIVIKLKNPLKCDDFGCVANRIIDGLFTLSIPLVSIMVLVGGFQILTSAGDPEKLKTGKKTILYSVGGFAAIIVAKGVALIIREFISK